MKHLNFGCSPVLLVALVALQAWILPAAGEPTPTSNATAAGDECPSTRFRCTNGNCIPLAWKCDEDDDCHDNSDELDCHASTCRSEDFTCQNHKCIPQRWVCDGGDDCHDGSDEAKHLCQERKCTEDNYECKGGTCISKKWVCDGFEDCHDGDDEDSSMCAAMKECMTDEFQCSSGQCISSRWHCDDHPDCSDGSDEVNCPHTDCDKDEFQCTSGLCIKKTWQCDGDFDCTDHSDEKNCSEVMAGDDHCTKTEFACETSGECFHISWKCDGDVDCEDQSDEKDCTITCRPDQFQCTDEINTYCIHSGLRCDGNHDCKDGSDEENCTYTHTKCPEDTYDCHQDGKKCMPLAVVCDGNNDCGNNEDENEANCKVDHCAINNGGCLHNCVNTYRNSSRCSCYPGYQLASDNRTCDDVDECKVYGTCSQLCTNTKGSYKCDCRQGYALSEGRYCKATTHRAELLLADRKDMRRIHLETYHYQLLMDEEQVNGIIAIDFDIVNEQVYWTDVRLERILVANLTNPDPKPVANTSLKIPDGVALDWIHRHLYWTDTGLNRIEVSTLDGGMRKVIIDTELDEPRAIVLDPKNAYMYWTDWGAHPKIEKCGMNNNATRKVIIDTDITWPNGLTIDYEDERLYWIDAKLHRIESCDLEGKNRRIILTHHVHLNHPFAITVFEDYLYWTDWPSESVKRFSKFGQKDEEVKAIALNLRSPMDLHVYHPYRQPQSPNYCAGHKCKYFCLPAPEMASSVRFTCECPTGMKVNPADSTDCVEDISIDTNTTASVPVPSSSGTDSPNRSRPKISSTAAPVLPTTAKPTPAPETSAKTEATTAQPGSTAVHEVTTQEHDTYSIGTTNQTSTEGAGPTHKEEEQTGKITGIVIGAIALLAILIAVAGLLIFRHYRRKNIKSMNFDNPVYRKTTEDQIMIEKEKDRDPSTRQPLTHPEIV